MQARPSYGRAAHSVKEMTARHRMCIVDIWCTMCAVSSYQAPSADDRGPARRIQAVDRAVALLKAVAASERPATVLELARSCGINRSTAWRLLGTLEHHGLIERDPATQRYTVGYAATQVAGAAGPDALVRRARPALRRFCEATGELVTLAVAQRFKLVYVDQVDPPNTISPDWLGRPLPLHATSAGKVFLAWLSDEERDAILPERLERYTPATITDRARLERELAAIRRDGYGLCVGENEEFSNGASAAVVDERTRPIAVVNVWGPSQRITDKRLPRLGRQALRAAHEISAALW
jgi:DNA-binding IclR family transcriptional regulator